MQEHWLSYLLHNLPVLEDVLECYIEFAQVVLPHAILVPADSLEQHALYADHREIEGGVPFWIEVLADSRRRLLGIAQRDDKKLACLLKRNMVYYTKLAYRIAGPTLIFCSQVSSLHALILA